MVASRPPTFLQAGLAPALWLRAQCPWKTDKQHGEAAGIPSGSGGWSCSVLSPSSCPGKQLPLFANETNSGKWSHVHVGTRLLKWQCGGKNAGVSEPEARLRALGPVWC